MITVRVSPISPIDPAVPAGRSGWRLSVIRAIRWRGASEIAKSTEDERADGTGNPAESPIKNRWPGGPAYTPLCFPPGEKNRGPDERVPCRVN